MTAVCKLCGGTTRYRFSKTVLLTHRADYVECISCLCLQVRDAPWLAEAYATERWAVDTGLVARNLQLAGRIGAFLDSFCQPSDLIVDYGGGTGLLTRLLRDMGWNVLCHDRYRKPLFVDTFHIADLTGMPIRALIASEVFEHLDAPRESLAELFLLAPLILFTTELYRQQDHTWWYLAPELGQHIFFFSEQALAAVGAQSGFQFVDAGPLKYFVRSDLVAGAETRAAVEAAIRAGAAAEPGLTTLVRYLGDPYRYVAADHARELEHFVARAKPAIELRSVGVDAARAASPVTRYS